MIEELINVDAARQQFGEPEYGLFRCWVQSSTYKRKTSHTRGDWVPVSQEEFDQNHEASRKMELDRFMGRVKGSFWVYERRLVKPGWPQALIEELKKYQPATQASATP